ncbi:hypothetical protein [Streptomyces marokkonensis]|uniref:hypothetical protein n=1 Tax=Streptomyces marokkonensis TaxID=324855 RepID=UPI00313841CC
MRFEIHPYSRWASPAGQRLLGGLPRGSGDAGDAGDDRTYLTSVAVRGVRAVGEPEVRAASRTGGRARGPERRHTR